MIDEELSFHCKELMTKKESLIFVKAHIIENLMRECFSPKEIKDPYTRESFQLAFKYVNKVFNTIASQAKPNEVPNNN